MFGGKYRQENAKNGISERLDFEIFWESMPPAPLRAHAFGASRVPSAIRKSGYGPDKSLLRNTKLTQWKTKSDCSYKKSLVCTQQGSCWWDMACLEEISEKNFGPVSEQESQSRKVKPSAYAHDHDEISAYILASGRSHQDKCARFTPTEKCARKSRVALFF